MLTIEFMTAMGLGFLLGARHALDADHVAAVSTIVSRHPDFQTSSFIGCCWGFGHTLVLLLAGLAVILLKVTIPQWVAHACEFGIGLLLVGLGGSLAWTLYREQWHWHAHRHEGRTHLHLHSHLLARDHRHQHWLRISLRPFLIGMAHGLAGSAALLLTVLSTVQTAWQGLAYILAFGAGSIVGMTVLGGLISVPIALSVTLGREIQRVVQCLASVASIGLGLLIMIRLGQ
jgi:cytochrome c biogenesis protein CcdA